MKQIMNQANATTTQPATPPPATTKAARKRKLPQHAPNNDNCNNTLVISTQLQDKLESYNRQFAIVKVGKGVQVQIIDPKRLRPLACFCTGLHGDCNCNTTKPIMSFMKKNAFFDFHCHDKVEVDGKLRGVASLGYGLNGQMHGGVTRARSWCAHSYQNRCNAIKIK